MRRFALFLIILSLLLIVALQARADEPPSYRLIMEDGQILSHGLVVKIPADIPSAASPELILESDHALLKEGKFEVYRITATTVMRRQGWSEKDSSGNDIPHNGTVLRFRIDTQVRIPFYKANLLVNPRVEWKVEQGGRVENHVAALDGRIGIANLFGVWVWTISVLMITVAMVLVVAIGAGLKIPDLLVADGQMSLSRFQVLLWTLATGTVVMALALQRFEAPTIPESLVVLMGLSLMTAGGAVLAGKGGTQSQAQTNGESTRLVTPALAEPQSTWAMIAGMICEEPNRLSLPRTQMFFWTIILLVVFLAKSIPYGIIWDVPWQMVTLMGLSQAGYVIAKHDANKQ